VSMISTERTWAASLHEFSRRNAGRSTRLEIDHDELGAQWQEIALTLRGVGVDPRSGRIEIMLDDGERMGAHLTHSIRQATDVAVLRGTDGRDAVLRIAHPGGQSLLTLV
jgi:small ligand-binding sensory domain FIST